MPSLINVCIADCGVCVSSTFGGTLVPTAVGGLASAGLSVLLGSVAAASALALLASAAVVGVAADGGLAVAVAVAGPPAAPAIACICQELANLSTLPEISSPIAPFLRISPPAI